MSLHSIAWWVTGDRAWEPSQHYKFPGELVDFSIPLCAWSATNLDDSPMRVAWWMHTFSAIISPRTRGRRYHGYTWIQRARVHGNSWPRLSMRRRGLLPRLGNSFQPVSPEPFILLLSPDRHLATILLHSRSKNLGTSVRCQTECLKIGNI